MEKNKNKRKGSRFLRFLEFLEFLEFFKFLGFLVSEFFVVRSGRLAEEKRREEKRREEKRREEKRRIQGTCGIKVEEIFE